MTRVECKKTKRFFSRRTSLSMAVAACLLAAGRLEAQEADDRGEDQGAAIAAIADAKAGALPVSAPSEEFVSARDLVLQNLEKLGLHVSYDAERMAIIQIGTAEIIMKDPANEPNFMAIRAVKANEAYLDAKAKVIRAINDDFSAMDRALTLAEFGKDETYRKFTEAQAALEAKRDALAEKLSQLDDAEATRIRGVTMSDRFGMILEGIAGRLDEKVRAKDIAEQKKALAEELKAECAQLQADYKALEKSAESIPKFPENELESTVKMLSKMPLLGSSILTQAESWDDTACIYSVSMALVWSPKLQENAIALASGKAVPSRKGEYSPHEWIRKQNLVNMVGPRRFTDKDGNTIFVGFAAADMTGRVIDRKAKKMLAEVEARKAVAFSLMSDMEAYRETTEHFREYGDDNLVSLKKLNDVVSQKCDINLRGCLELAQKELTHPITGRRIYVVAYYIDPHLVKDAAEILRKSSEGLIRQERETQFRRGQADGMRNAIEAQRASKDEYNRGVADGAGGIITQDGAAMVPAKAPPAEAVSAGASGSRRPSGDGGSKGGAFSGDTIIDTDF